MEHRFVTSRSTVLDQLNLLRGLPSQELRRTARLAAHIARQQGGEPLAAVHLLDDDFQHRLASSGGVPLVRTPVNDSMCVQVLASDRAIYAGDASQEARFAGNPFTSGAEPVRLYYSTPLRTSAGTVGTLCVFATVAGELDASQRDRLDDLADQTSAHLDLAGITRDVAHLATHDPLTGIGNRLLLSQALEAAMADPDRRPHEPALLLIDLDDFKRINDSHGHVVGDEVLRSTALRVAACVRRTDLVARLGGDELAVLLPELPDPARLDQLAVRVEAVAALPHDTSAGPVLCTASVGRALGVEDELAYELLGRADADMYARKVVRALPNQR